MAQGAVVPSARHHITLILIVRERERIIELSTSDFLKLLEVEQRIQSADAVFDRAQSAAVHRHGRKNSVSTTRRCETPYEIHWERRAGVHRHAPATHAFENPKGTDTQHGSCTN